MGDKFVAFDLEITKEIPEGTEDWRDLRPLGISCAATLTSKEGLELWHGIRNTGEMYPARMSPGNVNEMIGYLWHLHTHGYKIVTWNGLAFDFDILAEESQSPESWQACVEMALNHVDVAFDFLCDKGFMIALDTAAKGLEIEGKTEGMRGAMAPILWARSLQGQEMVLEYVAQDVKVTADVYRAVLEQRRIPWTSKSGRRNYWIMRRLKPATVIEALDRPKPDTSWMTNPRTREELYAWTLYTLPGRVGRPEDNS
jgi:hypothetical protein